jgi:hypothetical protein
MLPATHAPQRISSRSISFQPALGKRANRPAPACQQGRELEEFARKPRGPHIRSNADAPSACGDIGKPSRRVKRFFEKTRATQFSARK